MVEPAVVSYALAHECGYALFVTESGEGVLARVSYFDDNSLSETFGERVEVCPGCKRDLTPSPSHGEGIAKTRVTNV